MNIIDSSRLNEFKLTKVVDNNYVNEVLSGKFIPKNISNLNNKPYGFWISVNEGWEEWCKLNQPDWLENTTIINFELKSGFNIMVINNTTDILSVWYDYLNETGFDSENPQGDSITSFMSKNKNELCYFWDWLEKKYKLDGIYLTEYGEKITRYNTFLYGWDCESLVVFNTNMLKIKNGTRD